MQVLILAVQNGVDYKDLGTATSLAAFFRSMEALSAPRCWARS